MNDILLKVQLYLNQACAGEAEISEELVEEFGEACKATMRRTFSPGGRQDEEFRLRMSNVGRPTCQLQMEKAEADREPEGYNFPMKMLYGDLCEAAAIAILKASGVNVEKVQEHVTLDVDGREIDGTYDVKIEGKVWDIKSASPYAFRTKFDTNESGGYEALKKGDNFGYISQGFGYGKADGSPFGGWIAIEKANGLWSVVEVPEDYEKEEAEALEDIQATVEKIDNEAPFERCFEDEPETYYNKPTGNRVLPFVCSYCPYKWSCWPGLQIKPKIASKGKNPKLEYYTYIEPQEN